MVLFGFEDGHVGILAKQETDDGDTVTGRAKSPPLQVSTTTMAFTGLSLTALHTGSTDTLTVKSFLDKRDAAKQTYSGSWNAGGGIYGTALWNTDTVDPSYKTRRINLPNGSRGEVYQYEVSGTHQWRTRQAEVLFKPLSRRSR